MIAAKSVVAVGCSLSPRPLLSCTRLPFQRRTQSQVWIPDVDAVWLKADVSALSGEVDASLESGETKKVKVEELFNKIGFTFSKGDANLPLRNKNIGEQGINDMCNLDYLHEPAVLNNLRVRFGVSKPYTYTGPTCIAINPYKWITEIYTPELRRQFLMKSRDDLMPHAYASSARAFTEMHMQREQHAARAFLAISHNNCTTAVVCCLMHQASIRASLCRANLVRGRLRR